MTKIATSTSTSVAPLRLIGPIGPRLESSECVRLMTGLHFETIRKGLRSLFDEIGSQALPDNQTPRHSQRSQASNSEKCGGGLAADRTEPHMKKIRHEQVIAKI